MLTTVCKWYDAWKGEDSSYYKIEDSFIDSRSGINKTTLEFYIVYISTARIVLTTRETTRGDNYYEFSETNEIISVAILSNYIFAFLDCSN